MARHLRIGLIAPNYPPRVGGMASHAQGVAEHLAATDEVVVFTRSGNISSCSIVPVRPILTMDVAQDIAFLEREQDFDCWLGLDAVYAGVASRFNAPYFAYFHGNDFLSPVWGKNLPWVVRMMAKMPFIWRYKDKVADQIGRARIRRGLRSTRTVFTNSNNTKKLIERYFPEAQNFIKVLTPGLDEAYLDAPLLEREHIDRKVVRLLTVCGLQATNRRKNVDGVIHALTLLDRGLDVRYTVVGDGDDKVRLEQLVHQYGLENQVKFAGSVSKEDLISCYREADLMVLASKATQTDVEGFGIVYVEAAAMGVPSLCSIEGGAVEAVIDGVTGFVLPASEPADIASGITQFVQYRDQFEPTRIRGFAKKHEWPVIIKEMRNALMLGIKT